MPHNEFIPNHEMHQGPGAEAGRLARAGVYRWFIYHNDTDRPCESCEGLDGKTVLIPARTMLVQTTLH